MDTHITMKEMPESEKPVEKCFRYGAQALSDAELLAVILKSGTKGMTALQLAQFFLSKKGQKPPELKQHAAGRDAGDSWDWASKGCAA